MQNLTFLIFWSGRKFLFHQFLNVLFKKTPYFFPGYKDRLVKFDENGNVAIKTADNKNDYKNINSYAVNGAVHYANALLHYTDYEDIISIGVTGCKDESGKLQHEIGVYYVSSKNYGYGQEVAKYTDLSFLKKENFDSFVEKVKSLNLTEEEKNKSTEKREAEISSSLVKLNNDIYKNESGLGESAYFYYRQNLIFIFDNYYNFIYNYVMIVKNNLMSDLQQISDSHNKIITVEAASEKNISRALLSLMAEDGRLNRIAKGIYTLPETIPDELYILCLFSDNIIFSHESALFCNGLSERTPFEHSYTLPQGKRLSSSFSKGFKSYYCKQELFNLGKITVKTAFGNEVPCYDAERTICDVIKDKNKMDPEVYLAALKMYSKSENKNLKNLSMYAEKMNIVKKVRSALEVIL